MRRPKMNRFMKRWIDEAVEHHPEPFSAKEIQERVITMRSNNSIYITGAISVGFYLNNVCIREKLKGKNVYRRRK